jgi:Flp pilus assembly pilin Flp
MHDLPSPSPVMLGALVPPEPLPAETQPQARRPDRRSRRRGATAMEYCVITSLILVGLVIAIQQLGNVTTGRFSGASKSAAPAASSGGGSSSSSGGSGGGGGGGTKVLPGGGKGKGKGKGKKSD